MRKNIHGKVPVLEAFIVIGTAAMLAAAVIVWQSTQEETTRRAMENRQVIERLQADHVPLPY